MTLQFILCNCICAEMADSEELMLVHEKESYVNFRLIMNSDITEKPVYLLHRLKYPTPSRLRIISRAIGKKTQHIWCVYEQRITLGPDKLSYTCNTMCKVQIRVRRTTGTCMAIKSRFPYV